MDCCGDASPPSTFLPSNAWLRAFVFRKSGWFRSPSFLAALAVHAHGMTLWTAILLPALVVSTVVQPNSVLSRVLEWPPLRWIGALSYSLYLWQELFLPEIPSEMARGAFHYLQRPPWNIVAILLCAFLSRYLIEIPMNRLGHRLSASPLTLPRRVESSPAPS